MSSINAPLQSVRISKIAGRYLVFDPEGVAQLRRWHDTCGYLVGTAPQQPTQNIFLGLPIELRPEEVLVLLQEGFVHIVDDAAAHRSALTKLGDNDRRPYIDSLKRRKKLASQVYDSRRAKQAAEVADRLRRSAQAASGDNDNPKVKTNADDETELFQKSDSRRSKEGQHAALAVTPTCSNELLSTQADIVLDSIDPSRGSLCRALRASGFYTTPGLRFGSQYSVYPGDPLRYHAHFMANQYGWDEGIPILDIVGGGRLATAVKKAFLIGGGEPSQPTSGESSVRTFSIEWASM